MDLLSWRPASRVSTPAKRSPRFSSPLRSASDAETWRRLLAGASRPRVGSTSPSDTELCDHSSHPLCLRVAALVRPAQEIDLLLRFVRGNGESVIRLIRK